MEGLDQAQGSESTEELKQVDASVRNDGAGGKDGESSDQERSEQAQEGTWEDYVDGEGGESDSAVKSLSETFEDLGGVGLVDASAEVERVIHIGDVAFNIPLGSDSVDLNDDAKVSAVMGVVLDQAHIANADADFQVGVTPIAAVESIQGLVDNGVCESAEGFRSLTYNALMQKSIKGMCNVIPVEVTYLPNVEAETLEAVAVALVESTRDNWTRQTKLPSLAESDADKYVICSFGGTQKLLDEHITNMEIMNIQKHEIAIEAIDKRTYIGGKVTNYVVKKKHMGYVLEYYTATLWVVRNGPLAVTNATLDVGGILMEGRICASTKDVLQLVQELEAVACGQGGRYAPTIQQLTKDIEAGVGAVNVRLKPMVKRHRLMNLGVLASKATPDQVHIKEIIEYHAGVDWSEITKLESKVHESEFGRMLVAMKPSTFVVFTVENMPGRPGETLDNEVKEMIWQLEASSGVKILRLYSDKYAVARPAGMTEEGVKEAMLKGNKDVRRATFRLSKAGAPGDRTTLRFFALDVLGELKNSFDEHGVRLLRAFDGSEERASRAFIDSWYASRGEGIGVATGEHGVRGDELGNVFPAGKRNKLLQSLALAATRIISTNADIIGEYGPKPLPVDAIKMDAKKNTAGDTEVKVVAKDKASAEVVSEYLSEVSRKFVDGDQEFTIYTGDAKEVEQEVAKEQIDSFKIDSAFISLQKDLVVKIKTGFPGSAPSGQKLKFNEGGTDTKYRHVTDLMVAMMSDRPLKESVAHGAIVAAGAEMALPTDIKKLVTSGDAVATETLTGEEQIKKVMHRARFKVKHAVLLVLKSKADVVKALGAETSLAAKGLMIRKSNDTVQGMLQKGSLHTTYAKAVREAIKPTTTSSQKSPSYLSQSIRNSRSSFAGSHSRKKPPSLKKVKLQLKQASKRKAEAMEETRSLAVAINAERGEELEEMVSKRAKKQRKEAEALADRMAVTAVEKGDIAYATYDASEQEIDDALREESDGDSDDEEEDGGVGLGSAGGGRGD
jgi:hypothetical protein